MGKHVYIRSNVRISHVINTQLRYSYVGCFSGTNERRPWKYVRIQISENSLFLLTEVWERSTIWCNESDPWNILSQSMIPGSA